MQDQELVNAVDQMGEKKQIQNLLAHELISKDLIDQKSPKHGTLTLHMGL